MSREHPHWLYGLMAEFETAEALLHASRQAYEGGYRRMDAYAPYPVEGLAEALGLQRTWISVVVLAGGILGAAGGFGMQFYASVIAYPLNAGGKPLNSWPAFLPITFETAILGAAFAAILGFFFLSGLPEPYHPVFNAPAFDQASRDRFFLSIEVEDPQFELDSTRAFLQDLDALEVVEVPR